MTQQQSAQIPKDASTNAPTPTVPTAPEQQQIGNPAFPHVHPERNALSENKSDDIGW